MKHKYILLISILAFYSFDSFSQATNQVTHLNGIVNVAGTDVNVTKSGCVDAWYQYCPSVTSPYMPGFTLSPQAFCDGFYNFQFTPPVEVLTLNFSGVTNSPGHEEIVILDVNGFHYSIPAPGSLNTCDDYAVLNSDGNIAGCNGCIESGWKGTTIYGPITELRVKDSVIQGFPGGIIFSLYVSSAPAAVKENYLSNVISYPNPFNEEIQIYTTVQGHINMFDSRGALILSTKSKIGDNTINTKTLAPGSYIVQFLSNSGESKFDKMIKL